MSIGLLATTETTTLTPTIVGVIALAALMIGMAKGGISGLANLMTLLVSWAVPITVAIGVLLPILMIGDISALVAHWGRWDRRLLVRLLPGAAVGVGAASFFLTSLSEDALRRFLMVATLAFVAYRLLEPRLRAKQFEPKPWLGAVAGVTAGITSTAAHIGGPPVAAYLLTERVEARTYVATSAALFFMINWFKVPGYLAADVIDAKLLMAVAPTFALVPVGIVIGRWVVTRINQQAFDHLIMASLVLGAVLLVV